MLEAAAHTPKQYRNFRAEGVDGCLRHLMLCGATMIEACHVAAAMDPSNEFIQLIAADGLEGYLVHEMIPKHSAIWLATEGNAFHGGASTNFIELYP